MPSHRQQKLSLEVNICHLKTCFRSDLRRHGRTSPCESTSPHPPAPEMSKSPAPDGTSQVIDHSGKPEARPDPAGVSRPAHEIKTPGEFAGPRIDRSEAVRELAGPRPRRGWAPAEPGLPLPAVVLAALGLVDPVGLLRDRIQSLHVLIGTGSTSWPRPSPRSVSVGAPPHLSGPVSAFFLDVGVDSL